MRKTNRNTPFGLLFTTTAALVSPAHEAVTQKPLYGSMPPLEIRTSVLSRVRSLLASVDSWRRRAEERRKLALLSDHMLNDIGLEPSDVAKELEKPFWRT